MPVGLRASVDDAAAALRAHSLASSAHHFLGVSAEGVCGIVRSTGNPDVLLLLSATLPPDTAAGDAAAAATALVGSACDRVRRHAADAAVVLEVGGADATAAGDSAVVDAAAAAVAAGDAGLVGLRMKAGGSDAGWQLAKKRAEAMAEAARARRRVAKKRAMPHNPRSDATDNLRIAGVRPLLPPACLIEDYPRRPADAQAVRLGRSSCQKILRGDDDRLIVLVGPAAVDDISASVEFGARLAAVAAEVRDDLLVMQHVRLGPSADGKWAGLLKDPAADGSYQINRGLKQARELLLQLNQMGVPAACDFGDTVTPQFFADLVSCAAVSAPTPTLRGLVSGLSMPVVIRAPAVVTEGGGGGGGGAAENVAVARASLQAASTSHQFFGVMPHGVCGIVHTSGNDDCALLVRGGAGSVADRVAAATAAATDEPLLVECGGPTTAPSDQAALAAALADAAAAGTLPLRGVALSAYLLEGAQPAGGAAKVRGMSVTDPCLDWMGTQSAIHGLAAAVRQRRAAQNGGENGGGKKRARAAEARARSGHLGNAGGHGAEGMGILRAESRCTY